MHNRMEQDGVPATQEEKEDTQVAHVPFLAILPDMSLNVAILEQDVYASTAPLLPRNVPMTTVGETEPMPDTPPAAPVPRTSSTRFIPPTELASTSSHPRSTSSPLATGAPEADSTSIPIPQHTAQHTAQHTPSISQRLRQFGLMALPSLRRAELADIPDSLVWSVAVVDPDQTGLPLRLTRSSSAASRSGWLPGSSRSFRFRGSSASRGLSRGGGSLHRGASLRSGAGGSVGDTAGLGHSAAIPVFALARSGDIPLEPVPFRGASPPLPHGHSGPIRSKSPALRPLDEAAGGSGGWVVLSPSASASSTDGGAARHASPLGQPVKAQRSRSLRNTLSFRSAGGDAYERLEDVDEGSGEVLRDVAH